MPEAPKIDQELLSQICECTRMSIGDFAEKPMRIAVIKHEEGWCQIKSQPNGTGHWAKRIQIQRRWFRFYYDGAPEWCERKYRNLSGDLVTVVYDCMFGDPPKKFHREGRTYRMIGKWAFSPEVDCPGQGEDNEGIVSEQNSKDGRCYLCDEPVGEQHSMIYIGEGWHEVLYWAR